MKRVEQALSDLDKHTVQTLIFQSGFNHSTGWNLDTNPEIQWNSMVDI